MTYREIRDHKFKILFTYYFRHTTIDEVLLNYFEGIPYEEDDDENTYVNDGSNVHKSISINVTRDEEKKDENVSDSAVSIKLTDEDHIRDIKNKVRDCASKTEEIDKLIETNLDSWDLGRVGKAELAIIRLAIYEMYYDASMDLAVAINEAVELSKVYCDEKASKFVNGVLATIYKKKKETEKTA